MDFQRARNNEQIENRQRDIIDACDKIYSSNNYSIDSITIQAISKMTTIARSSIYTYYNTKEEILLDLLKQEYLTLIQELNKKFNAKETLRKEEFAKILAKSFEGKDKFLRLSSIQFTSIEQNCSIEKLTEFSTEIQPFFNLLNSSLAKFFPNANKDEIGIFVFNFHCYLNGIFPYLNPTFKQLEALKVSSPNYKVPDFYNTIYNGTLLLLGNIQKIENKF